MAFSEADPKPLVACWASAGVGNTEGTGSPVGSVAIIETGFGEINGDLREADFEGVMTHDQSVWAITATSSFE
jgi:hypothetical protein